MLYSHSNSQGSYATHMVMVLVALEVVCFALIVALMYVVHLYLDQYNAEKDTILKCNALFIGLYLIGKYISTFLTKHVVLVKATNQLTLILHFEGTILTSQFTLFVVQFLNSLAIIFFYISCSLNLYKW